MREKNFNTGLRGVLFEAQHYARMGAAVWLYGWLVLRQTHQTGEIGHVLGGAPIAYREIEEETGFNRRTLESWMRVLRREGYIETRSLPGGIAIRILKAKKHSPSASGLRTGRDGESRAAGFERAHTNYPQPGLRGNAEGVREGAYQATQNRVADRRQIHSDVAIAGAIGSELIERIKDKGAAEIHTPVENPAWGKEQTETHDRTTLNENHNANPSWLRQIKTQLRNQNQMPGPKRDAFGNLRPGVSPQSSPLTTQDQKPAEHFDRPATSQQQFPWEVRERIRLLRRERDEEVRRELHVGTGPEVHRR
jgi:hypothetical protein